MGPLASSSQSRCQAEAQCDGEQRNVSKAEVDDHFNRVTKDSEFETKLSPGVLPSKIDVSSDTSSSRHQQYVERG